MAWVLERAAAGDVFAAGHGESGNDIPLCCPRRGAERVEGGWEITGHKIFGSLSPVWDWLGVHAMDTSDPEQPRIVHGFVHRSADGYRIEPTWDMLGMRATESNDTVLDGAFVADEHVALVCPAGFAGAGMFQVAVFAWAMLGFAQCTLGLAHRAFDLTVERVHQRGVTGARALHGPPPRGPALGGRHADGARGRGRAPRSRRRGLVDTASTTAPAVAAEDPHRQARRRHPVWQVVDTALDLTGGAGIFRRNRMEQMFRDARLGRFHPGNSALAHELVGKFSLGIDPDEQPRWG